MLLKLILICTLCLISVPSFATQADFEKRMARGVAALDSGDTAHAQEEFRAALTEHPTDSEAALYLAIALNRANDPNAESALKTALRLEPGNPRINFELGMFYYNGKMYEEAGDYFENILTLKPGAELQTAAESYLAEISSRSGGKLWGVTFLGGMQYDSNVPLAADGVQLPNGTDRRGDWRGVLNLGLSGVAFRDSQQELTGSYSLYQTLHVHLADFNLTQNLFEATYKRLISPFISAKVSGSYESILLGGDQFVSGYTVNPGLLATFQEGMTTGLEYRFRDSYFTDSETYPTNTERDGVTHSLMVNHRQQISTSLNLRVGYTFERELTKVSSWSAVSHRGLAGLAVSLPHALLFDLSWDVVGKKYDDIQTDATQVRSDTTHTGAASLTWQAYENIGVSVGYHYTLNDSNIDGYDYTRGITSIMFQGRY